MYRENAAFEAFVDSITLEQESGKYAYRKFVMEAIVPPRSSAIPSRHVKARLIEILYKDMSTLRSKVNYKEIDDSEGDFTKFKYYDVFVSSLDNLNNLLAEELRTGKADVLKELNQVHDIIISMRSDFEYGYRFNVGFIIGLYNTFVLLALEYLNLCVVMYVDYIRNPNNIDFSLVKAESSHLKDQATTLRRNTQYLISAYEKGELAKLMKEFKASYKNFVGELLAGGLTVISILTTVTISVTIVIAILNAIRELIYLFYSSTYNISEWAKIQNNVLKESIKVEKDATALKKQERLSTALSKTSDFIEHKIIYREKKAKENIKKSNKEKFTKTNLDKAPEFEESMVELEKAHNTKPVEKTTVKVTTIEGPGISQRDEVITKTNDDVMFM